MKKYSNQQTIDELNKEITSKTYGNLYNSNVVNRTGKTSQGEYYTEIIAKELLSHIKEFDKIPKITRASSYKTPRHDQITIDLAKSNRHENIFAKRIFGLEFNELGKILEYEIPLRNDNTDKGLKAFDLLSYKEDDNCLYLIELKYLGSKETLLRAILECYTYLKIVDHKKLISDFSDDISEPASASVKPVVLMVTSDSNKCNPYTEYDELDSEERPMLKALSLALGIKIVTCDLPFIFDAF